MPESMQSAEVRSKLVDALRLDLVGPADGLGDTNEVLPRAPSRWYLTGLLVPIEAAQAQRTDEQNTDELDQPGEVVVSMMTRLPNLPLPVSDISRLLPA